MEEKMSGNAHRGSRRRARSGAMGAMALCASLVMMPPGLAAQQAGAAAPTHGAHDLSGGTPSGAQGSPLREPGNAAFATIQEAVRALEADPSTDWSKVDLEALRQHLIDMQHFTLDAVVVSREEIDGGLRVTVTGDSPEATASIQRAVRAHAPALAMETGWSATGSVDGDRAILQVTTSDPADVARIRGLGYIGLMASGAHHQLHHWAIVHGQNPHDPGAMHDMHMHQEMHRP